MQELVMNPYSSNEKLQQPDGQHRVAIKEANHMVFFWLMRMRMSPSVTLKCLLYAKSDQ